MIPKDWVQTHYALYKSQYDFTLPRDKWSPEQARDFAELAKIASDKGIISGGTELTYETDYPYILGATQALCHCSIPEAAAILALATITPAPPVVIRPMTEYATSNASHTVLPCTSDKVISNTVVYNPPPPKQPWWKFGKRH